MKLDKYTIYRDGLPILAINEKLLIRQDKMHNLERIKELHMERLNVEELMKCMNPEEDKEALIECDKELTRIEFRLQYAWGFPKNCNFHRFWERPHCQCPKLDNEDSWGTKYSIFSEKCPLHWERGHGFPEKEDSELTKVANDAVKLLEKPVQVKIDLNKMDMAQALKATYDKSEQCMDKKDCQCKDFKTGWKIGEILVFFAMIIIPILTLIYLATHQNAFKEMAKHFIGMF